jgi:hypothetical protein
VDPTPLDDSEFAPGAVDSPAAGRVDLLTVVAHELGHALGLDSDASDGLMGEFLAPGVRRLPSATDAAVVAPARADWGIAVPAREATPDGGSASPLAWVAPAKRPRLYADLLTDVSAEEWGVLS